MDMRALGRGRIEVDHASEGVEMVRTNIAIDGVIKIEKTSDMTVALHGRAATEIGTVIETGSIEGVTDDHYQIF